MKRLVIISLLLFFSCYDDPDCKDGDLQQIGDYCYECEDGEWNIIDCEVLS